MSTHAAISIKVRPCDYERVSNTIGSTVNELYPYITVYCHADGYYAHTGHQILNNYNSYESALELILGGGMSGIYDSYPYYYASHGETYEENAPWTDANIPNTDEWEYIYVYTDSWFTWDRHENKLTILENFA